MAAVGAAVVLPMLMTPLDRPRMYVLPVFFFGLLSAAGLVWVARRLRRRIRGTRA
jgi:hypothetical protein